MTKNYKRKKTIQSLEQLALYRASRDYCTGLIQLPNLPIHKKRAALRRIKSTSHTIEGIETAITLLPDIEREIIELHYIKEQPFSEIEETVHLERSSVYRYHAQGIDKIASVLYGIDD